MESSEWELSSGGGRQLILLNGFLQCFKVREGALNEAGDDRAYL